MNYIRCVSKIDRLNPHERITHVGGTNDQGMYWRVTQEEAIAGIESGRWQFVVATLRTPIPVVVATSQWGNKYLKTLADGQQPNNLLNLPECIW